MADDPSKQTSALLRRHEQLKRWEESDTNKAANAPRDKPRKVKFQDGCIFLAACSSGDTDEVLRLLKRGADINTANVDGLTALHQACIDDNQNMVEFLVENGADVDVCDNEGWTPLHATASCGFSEIARYLIEQQANVAAVNNDGDLPIDICEDKEMEKLLQEEMDAQGVDADAARSEEENQMLADANKWLNNKSVKEKKHPKTGATALHVACAKGYMKVISILLKAGADVNCQDFDGWTPLHAAAHWGSEEAAKVLVEHMCDMDIKNNGGQTAFDVADSEIIKLLEELKRKQASQKDKLDSQNEIIQIRGQHQKRRSSVTRMSGDQKQSVIVKTVEQERAALEAALQSPTEEEEKVIKSSSSSNSEEESSEESETEKQNEINRKSLNQQPKERDKPPITTVVETHDVPKMDQKEENITIKDKINEDALKEEVPTIEKIGDVLNRKEIEKEYEEKEISESNLEKSDSHEKSPSKKAERLNRSLSAPAPSLSDDQVPLINLVKADEPKNDNLSRDTPHWRAGLRKMGSTSMVAETINENDKNNLPRSASSPRLAVDNNKVQNETSNEQKPFLSSSSTSDENRVSDRYGSSSITSSYGGRSTVNPYRSLSSSYQSSYLPNYKRLEERAQNRASLPITTSSTPSSTSLSTSSSISSCITSPYTNYQFKRPYGIPKRDEEAETQRKARAKRARETRRSTQGVTLEDIQKAEEVLSSTGKTDTSVKSDSTIKSDSSAKMDLSTKSESDKRLGLDTLDSSNKSVDSESSKDRTSLSISERGTSENDSMSLRRRREEDGRSSSFRRSRDSKDITTDTLSAYIPRRERNALSLADSSSSSLSVNNTGLSRSQSLRNRVRNGEVESQVEEKPTDTDNKTGENRRESSALMRRRRRQERRSTGIPFETNKDEEEEKEKEEAKKEETRTEDKSVGRYGTRYGSTSDVPDRYSRPTSYIEQSKSTSSIDTTLDYKRLYEDEKSNSERLKKELAETKRELLDAKAELDKLVKRSEQARVSDTNEKREKRALERKLSEMEEELKQLDKIKAENSKLKEENRALTRVISKLSK